MSFHKPTKAELRYAEEVMARLAAIKTHDFDQHDYCSKCGQSHEHVCDTLIECFGQPNLIAISHLRRQPAEDAEFAPNEALRKLMREPSPWDDPKGAA